MSHFYRIAKTKIFSIFFFKIRCETNGTILYYFPTLCQVAVRRCISSNHGHGLADYNNATARSVTLLFSPLFTSKCGEITQLWSVAKLKVLKCVVVKESALENRKAEN